MKIQILFFFAFSFVFSESVFAMTKQDKNQQAQQTANPSWATATAPTVSGSTVVTRPVTTPNDSTVVPGSSPATTSGTTGTSPVSVPSITVSSGLSPIDTQYGLTDRIDLLQPEQRRELDQRHLASNCVTKHGEHNSCGYREKWSNMGDPHFTWDPYMNQIKPGTPVDIEVKCDPKTKRFVTNVSVNHCTEDGSGKETCKKKYFSNPYFNCSKNDKGFERCEKDYVSKKDVFSDTPQNWLASPGLYFGNNETPSPLLRSMKTDLPPVISRTQGGNNEVKLVAQEHRIAGEGVIYKGARIPNLLWLNGNGNAFHGSRYVDGRPRSQGCLRLSQGNAMALYRLGRRVGPKNFTVRWQGYGPPTPPNGRPLCAQSQEWNKRLASIYAQAFKKGQHIQVAQELENAIYNLARSEGRTPVTSTTPELSRDEGNAESSEGDLLDNDDSL